MSDLRTKLHSARTKLFRRTSPQLRSSKSTISLPDVSNGRNRSPPFDSTPSDALSTNSPHLQGTDSQTPNLHLDTSAQANDRNEIVQFNSTNTSNPALEESPELLVEAPTPDFSPTTTEPLPSKSSRHRPLLPTPESQPKSPETAPAEQITQPQSNPAAVLTPGSSISPPSQRAERQYSPLTADYFKQNDTSNSPQAMSVPRKVWIKRAGASPTLVQIIPDDLVDDVRDKILRKYANSLGRTFDAPDVSVRIVPREKNQHERILNPEEPIGSIIEAYFPGGQSVEEALLVDVPRRRTPLPSPRAMTQPGGFFEDNRPLENGPGYFPPMPPATSPHPSQSAASHDSRHSYHQDANPHSIAILETGQLPVLPSPREKRSLHRPRYSRNYTSSPTVIASTSHATNNTQPSTARPHYAHAPTAPPLPTPPAPEPNSKTISAKASTPPLERINSPRLTKSKKVRKAQGITADEASNGRKDSHGHPQIPLSFIEATMPPINVLIVEDNIINLRLLEGFFTRKLKVRWQTAMNGREAVNKWRGGGFHLVLMDIQLPIMSGLEATKEIRRLERLNGIGVFAKSQPEMEGAAIPASNGPNRDKTEEETPEADDMLDEKSQFKSPVIIVALTASSLQSDRHEALAAGCNDFLTKPVQFSWLERKVKEWGCMQALIDFDGWRKWKNLAEAADAEKKREEDLDPERKAKAEKKEAKRAQLMAKLSGAST